VASSTPSEESSRRRSWSDADSWSTRGSSLLDFADAGGDFRNRETFLDTKEVIEAEQSSRKRRLSADWGRGAEG